MNSRLPHAASPLPSVRRSLQRRGPAPLALEQRFMFDGAAVADAGAASAATPTPDAGSSPGAADLGSMAAALTAAQQQAEKLIADYFQKGDTEQLFALFNGGQDQASQAWQQAAGELLDGIRNGTFHLALELRSNSELNGAFGAFSAQGPNGTPVIFINADWLAGAPDSATVDRILIEEIGHGLDNALNPHGDTAGDEGEAFAAAVIGQNLDLATRQRIAGENDFDTVYIDGRAYIVEDASVTFTQVYVGTPSALSEEASALNNVAPIAPFAGTDFRFVSSDPAAPYYSGNNVTGYLQYKDAAGNDQSLYGVVSRQFKTNGVTNGFYFYTPGADGVIGTGDAGESAYLLVINPAKFTTGGSYGTSSDPVDSALNNYLNNYTPAAALADTGIAVEKSGSLNDTGGSNASGNVLSNDSGSASPSVNAIGTGNSAGTPVNTTLAGGGTSITGTYGILTIGSDGNYVYVITEGNAAVQALRGTANTLTETFTYQITDTHAPATTSTATLKITIQGANDKPIAVADYGTAKVSLLTDGTAYGSADAVGSTATGNVLSNDSDVDKNQEVVSVAGLTASGSYVTYSAGGTATSLSFDAGNGSFYKSITAGTATTVGDYLYTTKVGSGGTAGYYLLKTASGANITVTSKSVNADGTYSIGLSGTIDHYVYGGSNTSYSISSGSTKVDFYPDATKDASGSLPSGKEATVNTATAVQYSTVTLNGIVGNIVVGMSASGTNISGKVTAVSTSGGNTVVTLDQQLSSAPSGTISFLAAGGTTVNGLYGTLKLNTDGTYTYTPTPDSAGGTSGTDTFTYTVTDLGGLTSASTLSINVRASSASDPNAKDDTLISTEQGVSAGTNSSGNVLTGAITSGSGTSNADTTPAGSNTVTGIRTATSNSNTTITAGTPVTLQGIYGSLQISSTGAYTYTVNNANTQVDALNSGDSVTDIFYYTITNTGSKSDTALLSFKINGANDAPVASNDTLAATEDTPITFAAADLLGNDSDVDDTVLSIANVTSGTGCTVLKNADGTVSFTPNANFTGNATFTYTITDAHSGTSTSATVTVAVEAVNDAPVARANTYTVTEDTLLTGHNLITDTDSSAGTDSDIETATASLNLAKINGVMFTANGTDAGHLAADGWMQVTLSHGTLFAKADGSFDYQPTDNDSSGDSFTYAMTDGTDNSNAATVTLQVSAVNDAPVNTVSGAKTVAEDSDLVLSGFSIADIDAGSATVSVRLSVGHGSLTLLDDIIGGLGAGGIAGNGSGTVTLTGTLAQINATLAGANALTYRGSSNYHGSDTLTVLTDDQGNTGSGGAKTDSDTVAITVTAVNDAPSGSDGNLAVPENGSKTLSTADFGFSDPDGDELLAVTITTLPGAGSLTLNGSPVLAGDSISAADIAAGKLVFTPVPGDSGASYASFTFQVQDDGGTPGIDLDASPNTLSIDLVAAGTPTVSVGNVTVSEASPYAVFEISLDMPGSGDISFTPSLSGGSATVGADIGNTADLEYYDGSGWVSAAGGITLHAGTTSVLVRTAIANDGVYEGSESFSLSTGTITGTVTNSGAATGTGTIKDDGSSSNVFLVDDHSATPTSGDANDDTPTVSVNNVTVSEASPYVVFEVSLNHASTGDITFTPSLSGGSASVGTDIGNSADLQYYDGHNWVSAAGGITLQAGTTSVLVRTAVSNDGLYEGSESFSLSTGTITGTVTNSSAATGTGTIKDDGSSSNVFLVDDHSATPTSGDANDDTPTVSVNSVTVSEASPYVVFEVSLDHASSGDISFTPSLSGGSASVGTDIGNTADLEYYNGTGWVSAASGITLHAGDTSVLVRTAVSNDGVYEGSESFSLSTGTITGTVTNSSAATGTGTIKDDGSSSNVFLVDDHSATPTSGDANDDTPTVSVNNVTVSEASPYVVFEVSLDHASSGDISFTPSLTGGSASVGADIGNTADLEYYNGSGWVSAAGGITLHAGATSVLVRTAVSNDGVYEGSESFSLSTGTITGTVTNSGAATGTGTIKDDGSSTNVFNETDHSATPTTGAANDDTPTVSVNNVTVSEASPYVVFEVSLNHASTGDISFTPSLSGGSASVGTDIGTSANLQYYNGTGWVSAAGGITLQAGATSVLVRTAVSNDGVYEGSESFTLSTGTITGTVTNSGAATGTGTIKDDGSSSNVFLVDDHSATPTSGDANDDTPTVSVNNVTVSEASPYVVFEVSLDHASTGDITFTPSLSGGSASVGTDIGTSANLQYYNGTGWVSAAGGITLQAGTTSVLVRTAVSNDGLYEGSESFSLSTGTITGTVTNSGAATGTGTIKDDGSSSNVFLVDDHSATPTTGDANDDYTLPSPTVSGQSTSLTQPTLSGTFPAASATGGLTVSIDGHTYTLGTDPALTVSGNTWTLDLAVANQTLATGNHSVQATISDLAGHHASDTTSSEITIQATLPPPPQPPVTPPVEPAPPPVAPSVPLPEPSPSPTPLTAPPTAPLEPLVSRTPFVVISSVETPSTGSASSGASPEDTLTRPDQGAVRISVVKSDEPALLLFHGIPDQNFDLGNSIRFRLPPDAFMHTQENAIVRIVAERSDGGPLPAWLRFDPSTGEFSGTPPPGTPSELSVLVKAQDNDGREAATIFQIKILNKEQQRPAGRAGLSEQIRLAAQRPAHLERLGKVLPGRAAS